MIWTRAIGSFRRNAAARWLLASCLLATAAFAGCVSPPSLYQVSTLQALMQGAYEGQIPCSDLPRYGSLGIGTFDGLDGELILLDGQVYQARADGTVVCNPATTTPFADVVRFEPQTVVLNINEPLGMKQLVAMLEGQAGSKNLMYAVRIDGQFGQVKVRSIPRQAAPYPPLAEAAQQQRVFDLRDVHGTLVGFRFPQYASGVNMPGWHLHFISDDRRSGGHVLDLRSSRLDLRMQRINRFEMTLPDGGTFTKVDLGKDLSSEIRQVEK